MKTFSFVGWAFGILCFASSGFSFSPPYQKAVLPNGLTVIVHEDHSLPVVAVNVLYRVGSRDEQPQRTGFAHLFEHLMFMGTTRAPTGKFDAWMEQAGGSNNAWTSNDGTDYHETSPASALPLLLWLEADRLQTLGQEITDDKLSLQRDVVRNERRQTTENVPYGKAELMIPELLYPEGHPYHHPVIGSHEDLEAARVEDVQKFFATYYVPANASLTVAGDIKTADVLAHVTRYFGAVPGGIRPARALSLAAPRLNHVVRRTVEDQVELAKLIMVFHSSAHFAAGDAELDLLAELLATGKSSRLFQALVYEKKLAQEVSATQNSQDLSGYFSIEVVARPGVSLDAIEHAVDEVLKVAVTTPFHEAEVHRSQLRHELQRLQRLQSVAERATLFNHYEIATGNPGYFEQDAARYQQATPASVQHWAQATLTLAERVIVRIVPNAKSPSDNRKAHRPDPNQAP